MGEEDAMGAQHARIEKEPVQVSVEKASAEPSTPEEFLAAVHALLDHASPTRAQRVAAEGHARFPDHPELERLCRLLTLPPARMVPNNGRKRRDSQKIFHWLDENEIHYRGQWILVNEDGLLAAAPSLAELLKRVEELDQDDNSLIHHVP